MLLSAAYFPPVEYFAAMAGYSSVYVEACEHYQKQSYRNRCRILTSNGVEDLRVPVVHCADLFHTPIREVMVDYTVDWVRRTEYALETAYCSSPFFEYYRDELFAILDSRPVTLWDLDIRLTEWLCRKLGLKVELVATEEYVAPAGADTPAASEDLRAAIHPKRTSSYEAKPYWQVFRDKFGFVPGLSVLDLLFNEGPESICFL